MHGPTPLLKGNFFFHNVNKVRIQIKATRYEVEKGNVTRGLCLRMTQCHPYALVDLTLGDGPSLSLIQLKDDL